jgi:hypothetical protein
MRHHFLPNGCILTVCTSLDYNTREVKVGYALFNAEDERWIRKHGNTIARARLEDDDLSFNLTQSEPILCDYISIRALLLILSTGKYIQKSSLQAIQFEIINILNLLGLRCKLGSILD